MCKFCEPILGKIMRPHKEAECPLQQASYCCLCGTRGHFVDTCPNKPKIRLPDTFKAEPSVATVKRTRHVWIGDNNDAYMEYLKLHKQSTYASKEDNRTSVREHLAARGYTLKTPVKAK